MNSAYSSLINSIPGQQISLSGNFQDQINPIFNYSTLPSHPHSDSSPIFNLYNPAYAAVAQSRLLSSLNPAGSPNQNTLTSTDASAASSITSTDPNLPPFSQQGLRDATASPGVQLPFYPPSSHHAPPFATNNQLCCDFGSAWRSAAHMMATEHNPYVNYENAAWSSPYGYMGNPSLDLNSARRKNATRESTSTLKAWLQEHIKNPYPTKGEKIMLAIITKMTLTQVSTWFANARRRLKKENKMTWSPKNRSDDATNSDLETEHKCKEIDDSEDGTKPGSQMEALSDTEEMVSAKNGFGSSKLGEVKPKIWSLAHTATSGLFPMGLQSYPGGGGPCLDNSPDSNQGYPTHLAMPLIQNHPLYQHGFPHSLDVLPPNQLTCSDMKQQYSSLYADNNPNNFFAQKRSELL